MIVCSNLLVVFSGAQRLGLCSMVVVLVVVLVVLVVVLNGLGVGDSNFKSFIFFAVPLIFCFYGGCVWVALREEPGTAIERLKSLFCWEFTHKNVEDEQSILMRELQLAWRPACYQGIVGTLQVNNLTLLCWSTYPGSKPSHVDTHHFGEFLCFMSWC